MSVGKRAYDLLRGVVNHEWDRIQGVEQDLATQELYTWKPSPAAKPKGEPEKPATEDDRGAALKFMGLNEPCSFDEIQAAFRRLKERADPSRFPDGSPERAQAQQISLRIEWSYTVLSDQIDVTEKRFRSLEIE